MSKVRPLEEWVEAAGSEVVAKQSGKVAIGVTWLSVKFLGVSMKWGYLLKGFHRIVASMISFDRLQGNAASAAIPSFHRCKRGP